MIKELIAKLDRAALGVLTQYIRRWVEWQDYKKHKIDFMISMEWVGFYTTVFLGVFLSTALYVVMGSIVTAVVHAILWTVFSVFEWYGVQTTIHRIKPLYDILFSLREEPRWVEAHTRELDIDFNESRDRRMMGVGMLWGFLAVFAPLMHITGYPPDDIMIAMFVITFSISTIKMYIPHVNDFEPPKRKKKASEAISELVARLWGEFVGGFQPMPRPAYAGVHSRGLGAGRIAR